MFTWESCCQSWVSNAWHGFYLCLGHDLSNIMKYFLLTSFRIINVFSEVPVQGDIFLSNCCMGVIIIKQQTQWYLWFDCPGEDSPVKGCRDSNIWLNSMIRGHYQSQVEFLSVMWWVNFSVGKLGFQDPSWLRCWTCYLVVLGSSLPSLATPSLTPPLCSVNS